MFNYIFISIQKFEVSKIVLLFLKEASSRKNEGSPRLRIFDKKWWKP